MVHVLFPQTLCAAFFLSVKKGLKWRYILDRQHVIHCAAGRYFSSTWIEKKTNTHIIPNHFTFY